MINQPLLCENCFAENKLKHEVIKRGQPIKKCKICHSKNVKALYADDAFVIRMVRALIRFYYSEWDYNTHLGGEDLQSLVFSDNYIFNLDKSSSILDFEDAFQVIENAYGWYPENPEHISLGGGYWNFSVLDSVGAKVNGDLLDIIRKTFNSNYYDLELKATEQIERLAPKITAYHDEGTKFWRARLGVESKLIYQNISLTSLKRKLKYIPHSGEAISAPPFGSARGGRLNRQGVSVLYMASDVETAIAELRPHPGHLMSLGQFKAKESIKYANLADHDIREFLSDDLLNTLNHILSFSKVLNLPVQPENQSLYMATQLFSDAFRKAGFEAVSFRSSLGDGINFASFYPEHFEYVVDSGVVHKIKSLQYCSLVLDTMWPGDNIKDFKVSDDFISTIIDELEG